MRHDFPQGVKNIIAARAGHRCSNPDCGAVTSGPQIGSRGAVNVGVAAHITAAAEGGPRYVPKLTAEERSSTGNGIWLCQTCAKLVDSDLALYTETLLRQWKADAEKRAHQMVTMGIGSLDAPLELTIPTLDSVDSLLSFANTTITCVGRASELEELKSFLEADTLFSWWLWTGPAGIGKSRLAVELCRFASTSWHAGFLREASQSALGGLQAVRPTLVVVDYAAQRSGWLSEALAQLSQRQLRAKVRVLILEREASGHWWSTAQRHERLEESVYVAATMYAMPRRLLGLGRAEAREVIRSTAAQLGRRYLTTTQVETIGDQAERMDPDMRPLFVQVATMDRLEAIAGRGGRDGALRRVIARATGQLEARTGDSALSALAQNLQVFATAVGGLSVEDYAELSHTLDLPTGLLPDVFQSFGPSVALGDLVDGVRPDIVGELFVLDRLDADSTVRLASRLLLRHACFARPVAYQGFVERTVADHMDHPCLLDLLIASVSEESPLTSVRLAVAIMPLLGRSDHPVVAWTFKRLRSVVDDNSSSEAGQLLTMARYRFANLVRMEGDTQTAHDLYTEALDHCDPTWPLYGNILNNRGITLGHLGQPQAAMTDYSAVIDAIAASNEARACALNNRADVRLDTGDIEGSIADRSAVLELTDTTYNRRFIALVRRARALRQLGDHANAFNDIEAILATDDIAVEQKMAAKLMRAEWLIEDGEAATAQTDLDSIITSYRNFEDVEQRARKLLTPTPNDN